MTRWNNLTREDAKRLGIEGELELMKLEQKLQRKSSRDNPEEREQMKLAEYLNYKRFLWFHVPNEGVFKVQYLKKRAKLGVKKGVPDNFICEPVKDYVGVVIELKRKEGGRTTPEQDRWLESLKEKGWLAKVCEGADEAIDLLEDIFKEE